MAAQEVWDLQEHATTFRIVAGATAARQLLEKVLLFPSIFSNIQVGWTLRICSIPGHCLKILCSPHLVTCRFMSWRQAFNFGGLLSFAKRAILKVVTTIPSLAFV